MQNSEIVKAPDEKTAQALVAQTTAQEFPITDQLSFEASWAQVQRCDEVIKKLTEGTEDFQGFDEPVRAADKVHKALVALRKQFLDPVLAFKKRRLEARETYRLAAAAAQKKLDDEAAEVLRKQQAKDLKKDAKQLERQGEVEAAQVLREQAATLPLPVLPPRPVVPKQEGSVITPTWEFEIEDFEQLAIEYKLLDHTKKGERDLIESKVRADVKKFGHVKKFPGVRVWQTNKEVSRSK